MTTSPDEPPITPTVRCDSPEPDAFPTAALGASSKYPRCVSTASNFSLASATSISSSNVRESLGSDISAFSRQSSGSYQSSRPSDISTSGHVLRYRQSTGSLDTAKSAGGASRRRGFMRPQGTDFAASARSRESVLSLGSIAHLQYYFARTGLLDGKGGQLARKRQQKAKTLDLSALNSPTFLTTPKTFGNDHDSSYASMGSSPDLLGPGGFSSGGLGPGSVVESPIEDQHPDDLEGDYYSDGFDEHEPPMLPPTASTYNYREKPLPKPPSMAELRADLTSALDAASKALIEAKDANSPPPETNTENETPSQSSEQGKKLTSPPGWHEIQGMHILDVMTLAIRAAKIYYTSHERPDRLDAIKSEKEIRGELLSVMEVLKRMATRGFIGGMRAEEFHIMDGWISGLHALLATEDEMEAAEAEERAGWTWLNDKGWEDRPVAREEAFLRSMLAGCPDPVKDMTPLPTWTPIDRNLPLEEQTLPTDFLASLQNGLRLVQLHNCAVRKSRRRFGAIPTFHTDTQKPYRAADNLRYWIKAAELRWEVLLKADPLGLQYNSGPQLWVDFEDAILKWCRKVREEIASELPR
ncbi:hypothetical protein QBC37DRAFT_40012 [Rhypophila decipiens]|uniref:Uncharacterized protein n=1 Tax=Rhypophila decipiens TaxID=261697 RepID=A0AAN7BBJ0_9PEZI|nr:hypothetical protein QBC37DRAFT_40012 [Rhypophila decipiens]